MPCQPSPPKAHAQALVRWKLLRDHDTAEVIATIDDAFADNASLSTCIDAGTTHNGNCVMVASGIPLPRENHAEAIAEMALAMGPEFARLASEAGHTLQVRIGIDTGPVVAGVIGRAKFIYDLWGDTLNTASRMESYAPPGTIQVTDRTFERLRRLYEFRPRETIDVKGKGPMRPYLLLGRRRDHQTSAVGELHERPAHSRTASAANERSSPATGIERLGASVD